MVSFVCRCCGTRVSARAPENPNVCINCATFDWSEIPEPLVVTGPETRCFREAGATAGQVPSELEQFLEIEGPSVLECFHAVEEAKRAVAETLAKEQSSPGQGTSTAPPDGPAPKPSTRP